MYIFARANERCTGPRCKGADVKSGAGTAFGAARRCEVARGVCWCVEPASGRTLRHTLLPAKLGRPACHFRTCLRLHSVSLSFHFVSHLTSESNRKPESLGVRTQLLPRASMNFLPRLASCGEAEFKSEYEYKYYECTNAECTRRNVQVSGKPRSRLGSDGRIECAECESNDEREAPSINVQITIEIPRLLDAPIAPSARVEWVRMMCARGLNTER